ncbi:MAG: hypothetical protein ACKOFW_17295, partial [Planctomycetaceae bacterium]
MLDTFAPFEGGGAVLGFDSRQLGWVGAEMATGGDELSPADYAGVLAQGAQRESRGLAQAPGAVRNEWLARCAGR